MRHNTATHGESHFHIVRLILGRGMVVSASRPLDEVFDARIDYIQGQWVTFVCLLFRLFITGATQDLPAAHFKEVHLYFSEVKYFVIALVFLRLRLLLFLLIVLFRDRFTKLIILVSHIFSDKESVLILTLLLLAISEAHLLVVWGSENILGFSFVSKFSREDLTLDVLVRLYIVDGQSNSLSHDFSVEVVSLDVLL
jgi:hypothetical protein